MPSTKKLIEELWNSDRSELVLILKEYMNIMGPKAFGYNYFDQLLHFAKTVPHAYTDPWEVL